MRRRSTKETFEPAAIAKTLRSAADLILEPLFLIDRTRRIILANYAAQKLTALEETNLIGQQIESLLSLEDPLTHLSLNTINLNSKELLNLQSKIRGLAHTVTFLPLTYIPYFAAFKPRPMALAILTPRTSGYSQTPSADTIYHQLLGQLALRIAHDFSNSLTAIIGNAELIRERLATAAEPCTPEVIAISNEQSLEEIADVLRKSREMVQFINTLQEYARQQPTSTQTLDLNNTIAETMPMAQSLLGRKIQIEFLPSEDLPYIYMDRLRMDQIFLSILVHSKANMSAGGRITIETQEAYLGPDYVATHAGAREGNYTRLTITDSSTGMDPETLKHIFELRTSNNERPSLGLPTVYSLLKHFRGYIDIESWKGKGTRFEIYLPQTPATPTQAHTIDDDEVLFLHLPPFPTETNQSEEAAPPNGSLILVAEDDTDIQRFIKRTVSRAGYEAIITNNGNAALDLYRTLTEEGTQPALLIADLGLPGLDGRNLCNMIRKENPSAHLLLTSGHKIELDPVSRKTKEDSFDFLQKPFAPNVLLSTITRILSKPKP